MPQPINDKTICPVCEGEGRRINHTYDGSCKLGRHMQCEDKGQCSCCLGTGQIDEDELEDD